MKKNYSLKNYFTSRIQDTKSRYPHSRMARRPYVLVQFLEKISQQNSEPVDSVY